jgi:hypothetical protein
MSHLRMLGPAAVGTATELFAGNTWPGLVEQAMRWSRSALELSALTTAELESAVAYVRASPAPVGWLSLHCPVVPGHGDANYLAGCLLELGSRLAVAVQHPDILREPAGLTPLGRRLALENMDAGKPDGRLVPELELYFRALPEARFCLDVAHVKTVDPTMELGHALIDAFGDRLCEVHVSGIDADYNHVPLHRADLDSYAPVLRRCRHVPWILESLPADAPAK